MSEINEEKNTELENSENATPAAEETSGKEASAPGKAEKKSAKPEKKPAEIRNGNPAARRHKFNKRNFKHGTLAVVFTVLFLAAVVVLNVIVNIVSDRFDTTADLSDSGIYTLTS